MQLKNKADNQLFLNNKEKQFLKNSNLSWLMIKLPLKGLLFFKAEGGLYLNIYKQ